MLTYREKYFHAITRFKKSITEKDFLLVYNLFLEIIDEYPKEIEPIIIFVNYIYKRKETENSFIIEWIDKGLQVDEKNSELSFILGNIYLHKKEYDKAIRIYEKIENDFPEKYFNQAIANNFLGDTDEVISLLFNCISKFPKFEKSYTFLLKIISNIKKKIDIDIIIKSALKNFPNNPKIFYYIGLIELQNESWQKTWMYLTKAQKNGYDKSEIFRLKAYICEKYFGKTQSISYLKKSITHNDANVESYLHLLFLYLKNNNYTSYRKLLELALSKFPDNKLFHFLLEESKYFDSD